jgi:hypothetical protein
MALGNLEKFMQLKANEVEGLQQALKTVESTRTFLLESAWARNEGEARAISSTFDVIRSNLKSDLEYALLMRRTVAND